MTTTRPSRLLVAATLLALLTTGIAHAADTTTVRPAQLDRGANPAVPRVIGTTILDGDVRVKVDAEELQLLGRSGSDYVAVVYDARDSAVERISPEGDREVVVARIGDDQRLTHDGERLVDVRLRDSQRTRVRVRDAETGEVVARHTFGGFAYLLDADGDRVLLGQSSPDRTFSWKPSKDEVAVLSRQRGTFADLGADLLATMKGDPLEGTACSRLTTIGDRSTVLWRSCDDLPFEASPDGAHVATVPIGLDGPLGAIDVRTTDGTLVRTYRAAGSFGPVTWEDADSLLLTAYGARRSALVRCDGDDCERASALIRDGRGA